MQESGHHLKVIDLSAEQTDFLDYDPPHHKLVLDKLTKKQAVAVRKPQSIDGIVVHQTATAFGTTPNQVQAAGGDRVLAKHRRALGVAAHMTAFDTGFAVLAHPLLWYVYHGNALNARSLGLEIEGSFPGEVGAGPEKLVGPLLQAAKDGLAYLVLEGRRAGMPIRFIWAHRQSSQTRPNDPGEEIWRKIVLNYAERELGLISQPDLVMGGKSIPDVWKKSGGG